MTEDKVRGVLAVVARWTGEITCTIALVVMIGPWAQTLVGVAQTDPGRTAAWALATSCGR